MAMTRRERIERQEFLLNARAGNHEDLIVCPRCDGWGHQGVGLPEDEPKPCKLCRGERVVKRRVTVVVEDSPIGQGWAEFQPVRGDE
nr:hypothetical protein [uncultured Pseudodesulfovibrio sp.]